MVNNFHHLLSKNGYFHLMILLLFGTILVNFLLNYNNTIHILIITASPGEYDNHILIITHSLL